MKEIIIQAHDVGLLNEFNLGAIELYNFGLVKNYTFITASPFFNDAVKYFKDKKNISLGVHLALIAEWNDFKFGPVSPREKVSSLLDKDGNFFNTEEEFISNNPEISEIIIEINAQIDKAVNGGLDIVSIEGHAGLDYHYNLKKTLTDIARERRMIYTQNTEDTYEEIEFEPYWYIDLPKYIINAIKNSGNDHFTLNGHPFVKNNNKNYILFNRDGSCWTEMIHAEKKMFTDYRLKEFITENNFKLVQYSDFL